MTKLFARLRWPYALVIMLALPLLEAVVIIFRGLSPCIRIIEDETMLIIWGIGFVGQMIFAFCLIQKKKIPLSLSLSFATHALIIIVFVATTPSAQTPSPPFNAEDGILTCKKGLRDFDLAPTETTMLPQP